MQQKLTLALKLDFSSLTPQEEAENGSHRYTKDQSCWHRPRKYVAERQSHDNGRQQREAKCPCCSDQGSNCSCCVQVSSRRQHSVRATGPPARTRCFLPRQRGD